MKTKLTDIILVKTAFEREFVIKFDDNIELETDVRISHGIDEKILLVRIEYNLNSNLTLEDKVVSQFKYSSTHVAQFELDDIDENDKKSKDKIERFSHINAAAIIFPFIRENAATISVKAGMSPLIIPVTNFIKLYEEKNKTI